MLWPRTGIEEMLLGKEWKGKAKINKEQNGGWGFSSVVERLPSKRKALGSVLSSVKKKKNLFHS